MFHVLEGEVEFKTENGKQIVSKDGFVNIPLGGAIHCFKNTSEKPARLLCTVVPAGLENLFQEIGVPVLPGQTLPIPELTEERKAFLNEMDLKYNQQTYPKDFWDSKFIDLINKKDNSNWHTYGLLKTMKQIYLIVALSVMLLTSACYSIRTAGNSGKVPPGQAKKGTGSKSAKPFAPGQQKRN
ncbi:MULTISPECIES: cupin domain-containing protein [unclassified Pedobacter]|nr:MULTISPECIES: cupin domain-containing protein [unclassified Pedobacter]CAH0310177.1 hypothetical protein SRABI36_04988 [Pedobacter sp. Bi36]CAH0316560.1 hypothetical protein SRABI126_05024 [Pedobacter sp. Bi126]